MLILLPSLPASRYKMPLYYLPRDSCLGSSQRLHPSPQTAFQNKPFILTEAYFQRAYASSFFRYILPLLVGITILFLSDFLPNKFNEFKLATPPTVLLTFIFMQNGYQAEIQQLSYITFIDKLYYLSYFCAILQLSSTLVGINSRNRIVRNLRIKYYLLYQFYYYFFLYLPDL